MSSLSSTVERRANKWGPWRESIRQRVEQLVFTRPLNDRYERGEISSREFYDEFCRETGTKPDFAALFHAKSDIFRLNYSLLPVIARLEDAGFRLGLLSNTSPCHWEFLCGQGYGILPASFPVRALSYEIGALKPEPKIYRSGCQTSRRASRPTFSSATTCPATLPQPEKPDSMPCNSRRRPSWSPICAAAG